MFICVVNPERKRRETTAARRCRSRRGHNSWTVVSGPSRFTFIPLLLLAALATSAAAQDTSRTAVLDSLRARLQALEATVDVLQKQVAEQATTGVQTHSRIQLELTGRVVMNAFSNDHHVNNVDDPQFVLHDASTRLPSHGLGMAVRQTMFGVRSTVSDVLGGTFVGVVDADFYGGQEPSSGGRNFPLLRIRTAHGTLHWSHAELLAGQEIPLFSPQNPISPAASGTPDFVAAGNLWLWLPQVRVTGEVGSRVRLALQGAILAPASGDPAGFFDTDFDAAERTQRPSLESRVRIRWGEDEMMSEAGCAVHVGWVDTPIPFRPTADTTLTSRAVGCDGRIPFSSWLEVRGEWYTGQLMRGLGGGATGEGVGPRGNAVRNTAGWAQVNVHPLSIWSAGAGCGVDDPRDSDVLGVTPPTVRLRNAACAVYGQVKPAGPVLIGAEVRRLETRYAEGTLENNHINIVIGFEF